MGTERMGKIEDEGKGTDEGKKWTGNTHTYLLTYTSSGDAVCCFCNERKAVHIYVTALF